MSRPHDADVVVAGAGPVGLMTALMLAERGVAVEVIDQEPRCGLHDFALTLHPEALRLLDDVGVLAPLLQRGLKVERVALHGPHGEQATLRMAEIDPEFPYLLVLPQGTLDDVLERRLAQRDVRVRWDHRLAAVEPDGERVKLTIEKLDLETGGYAVQTSFYVVEKVTETRAKLVVGADGFHSLVRRRTDIDLEPAGDALTYAAIEYATATGTNGEGCFVVGEHGVDAFWPLPGGGGRWSVALPATAAAAQREHLRVQIGHRTYPHVKEERVHAMLRARAPFFDGEFATMGRSMSVRFERAMAAHFGQGRAWLVGDAGHVTAPAGGHSVNVGLREAHDLGSRVARVLGGASMSLLEAYDTERRVEWKKLLGVTAALEPTDGASAWLREHAAKLLPCLPGSGNALPALAAQLGLSLVAR
jgi:2-polyprenyl-6-methoxyphenol hydroxylase-like FAD-dependent oxidoreductase